MDSTTVINIIIYIIIIGLLIFALRSEKKDLYCYNTNAADCGEGKGRMYYNGRPNKNDDVNTLIQKIKFSAKYEYNTIRWRQSYIIALISAFLILFVLFSQIPSGYNLVVATAIIYIVIYLFFGFYQDKVVHYATDQIDRGLQLLQTAQHPVSYV